MYGNLTARTARDPAHPGRNLSETYGYTPEGLLRFAVSGGMSYRYEHDAEGRLVGKSASGRTLLSLAYDLDGNLARQEDVTGKVTEYTYNALDQLERVTDNGTMVAEYAYYPDGARKSLANGSLYTEYSYDGDRNLAGLKTVLGTEVLADNHYQYDRNGNRTEKQQAGGTTRYTYDSLNRLAKVEYPSHTEELYYDRAGNRSCRVVGGVEELYRYDPRNRLTEYARGGMRTKYEYDNAGNLLADDRARYTYDAFNRTERVETFDSHVQVNRYDPEGLRHELEEDGKLVRYIFRGDEVVAEETEGNIIRLIRGTELLASDAENARTYYHYASDELGSVTHVVTGQGKEPAGGGENPEGSVLNRYGYDARGNLALCEETVPNRFLYTGQQYDPVTRQYYLRARYYNPVIARFTQEDTYRGDGLNLYTYCRNNPVCYVDPSGHCGKDPNGDFMPPAVVPEGKQLPAVYVPQQEALRRWCANFQDDAGTAGRAGTGGNGDFMPPAVIPKQPLPSLDPKRPFLVPEPPRQLPAVIYPQPQDLLDGNPQNRVSGPVADVPNSGNRVGGSVPKPDFIVTPNGTVMDMGKNYNLIGSGMQGDWFQIHNIGKPEDVGFSHTHSPQLNTDGQHTSYNRVVTSTVADDIDLADHLLRTGKMTFRKKGRR